MPPQFVLLTELGILGHASILDFVNGVTKRVVNPILPEIKVDPKTPGISIVELPCSPMPSVQEDRVRIRLDKKRGMISWMN